MATAANTVYKRPNFLHIVKQGFLRLPVCQMPEQLFGKSDVDQMATATSSYSPRTVRVASSQHVREHVSCRCSPSGPATLKFIRPNHVTQPCDVVLHTTCWRQINAPSKRSARQPMHARARPHLRRLAQGAERPLHAGGQRVQALRVGARLQLRQVRQRVRAERRLAAPGAPGAARLRTLAKP